MEVVSSLGNEKEKENKMAIDGNFAGGFNEGISPLVPSLRQDRRTRAQNDFQQKLISDRQTADTEIRNRQRDDRLSQQAQAQRNFQLTRGDTKSRFTTQLLEKDIGVLERDLNRSSKGRDSVNVKILRAQAALQKKRQRILKQFELSPVNHPPRDAALQALTRESQGIISQLTAQSTAFEGEISGFNERLGFSRDKLRDTLTGSTFAQTLTGEGGDTTAPPPPGTVVPPPTITPPPTSDIFQKTRDEQRVLEGREESLKKIVGTGTLGQALGVTFDERAFPIASAAQGAKLQDLLGGEFTTKKIAALESTLNRASELGKDQLIAFAQEAKGSGNKLFTESVANIVGSSSLANKIDKFVTKEEDKLLTELEKADSFKSTLKSITPFARKENQKLRNILSGSLPTERNARLASLKEALEVAAKEGEDEFVTAGTSFIDRLGSFIPGIDTVGLAKKLFNLTPADKNFAKDMLQRIRDIEQAKRNKNKLNDLATQLGVK